MNTIFIIGIFLCFFLQFLLLSKNQQSVPDRILAFWMFFIGIHLFIYYMYTQGYMEQYPHLLGISHPIPLLYGPMLYLYILFNLKPNQTFNWKILLHFAPAIIAVLWMTEYFFFYTGEQKLMDMRGELNEYHTFKVISLFAFIFSGITYPIFSYRLLGKYKVLINENFAYEESISLNWLKYLIWGVGCIFLVAAVISVLREGMGYEFPFNPDSLIYFFIISFIFLLGFFGIRQQGIFTDDLAVKPEIVEPKSAGEYKRSGLKEDDAEQFHQKLTKLMLEKKPYLEPKLTLNNLALELDLSANHLSQIINQFEEKNFYDFVNGYRVEEFKQRVVKPENHNFSILAVALDSGFNSKSSFNHVFKKLTGNTPSEYMKLHTS